MYGRCRVHSAVLRGVEAIPVDVEVAVTSGMVAFNVVGMVDAAVQEARERVRAALKVAGFSMPGERVLVNLAPSSLRKTGSGFDLAIAVGILVATCQVPPDIARDALFVGEAKLSLSETEANHALYELEAKAKQLPFARKYKRIVSRLFVAQNPPPSAVSIDWCET